MAERGLLRAAQTRTAYRVPTPLHGGPNSVVCQSQHRDDGPSSTMGRQPARPTPSVALTAVATPSSLSGDLPDSMDMGV